ncbi:hypothetical protein [Streptomyces peucetius]|uniref:hypothetical protein n=1 Tax=Streptomyces peucetius TaxID=1950 RepID=UPI0039B10A03
MLDHARDVLDEFMSTYGEVRYAGIRLAECLSDALRVAKSRGLRLSGPDDFDDATDTLKTGTVPGDPDAGTSHADWRTPASRRAVAVR